jgi:hypothetical protein
VLREQKVSLASSFSEFMCSLLANDGLVKVDSLYRNRIINGRHL